MKLFIVQTYLGGGGAERVGVMLAKGLANYGHQVFFVTNLQDDQHYEVDPNVCLLNLVTSQRTKLHKWGSAIRQLRKLLKEYRPDSIIGIMELCSFIAKLSSIGLKIPVIATEHNAFERPITAPLSLAQKFFKYKVNRIYDVVTVLTDADKRFIGNRLHNVHVMPNPLALQPVEQIPEKKKVILAAGRLDAWHVKGFDVLIRAWANVVSSLKLQDSSSSHSEAAKPSTAVSSLKEFQDSRFKCQDSKELEPGTTETCNLKLAEDLQESSAWRLQIAGTGSEESLQYLKQLCKENGVEDSVDFLGFRTNIEELYKQSEIFVLSSRYEGFGLVLIEAMSQGCACVACDYNGRQREIITDDSMGLCCEPDNVEVLASSIKKMIDDEVYRREVQKNAIERSKFYTLDNTTTRWNLLLERIVK